MAHPLACYGHDNDDAVFVLHRVGHARPCAHHSMGIWGGEVRRGDHPLALGRRPQRPRCHFHMLTRAGAMGASCGRSGVSGVGGVGLLCDVSPPSLRPTMVSLHKVGGGQWAAWCGRIWWWWWE